MDDATKYDAAMYEVLAGDVFEVEGKLLAVLKLRLEVVGDAAHSHVHYTLNDRVVIRTADEFCAFLSAGLAAGTIRNVNRVADFA